MAQTQSTRIEALDTILFNGREPVSAFISKVESVFVVPVLKPDQRFRETWTHAGILVDKNVLPLPCLEEGKLYIFESILCGRILGYQYSSVMCVDHEIDPKRGFHIGPQIRELLPVIEEVAADVAVFKLDPKEQSRLLSPEGIEKTREWMLSFYKSHQDWSYPLNPLPQFAAASVDLYAALTSFRQRVETLLKSIPGTSGLLAPSKEIFCSEMVAKIYMQLGVQGFCESRPPKNNRRLMHFTEFTPLDLEVMDVLKGDSSHVVYIKLSGKILFDLEKDGNGRLVREVEPELQKTAFPYLKITSEHWERIQNGTIPPSASPSGHTHDGKPIYISRALVGKALQIGYTDGSGVMKVGWEGIGLSISYDHEILSLSTNETTDFEWVQSGKLLMGAVPTKALVGGCDVEGRPHYIARCRIVEPGNAASLGNLVVGPVSPSLGGAKFVVNGKEVTRVGDYEVLCRKTHFLERFVYGLGTDHYLVIFFAIVCYFLGSIKAHQVVLDWFFGKSL
ncbi:hypothetical protein BDR26DRAFT_861038 [Obelidium mucronatum]|nr:hypothetical protein BDR26DRAFT_861038 [Obelidium mucronatum]